MATDSVFADGGNSGRRFAQRCQKSKEVKTMLRHRALLAAAVLSALAGLLGSQGWGP
jgi:hypothetical protein